MGEPCQEPTLTPSSATSVPFPPPPPRLSLVQPPNKKHKQKPKVLRVFRSVFRSFPIITPSCKMPSLPGGLGMGDGHRSVGNSGRISGTLFGYRKGRVSLCLQENSRCLPTLVVELAMQTNVLQKEMSSGMVRIALECEKRSDAKDKTRIMDEALWTMYCNGKKTGYGVKREATDEDLNIMELLKPVSMGAGVLPGNSEVEGPDGELAYLRAYFERVVGSKDSETLYMLSPDGNNGPELRIQDGDNEEPKLGSEKVLLLLLTYKLSVQNRGLRIKAARGPKRPGVPKGASPQTS
ncbi:hypothetical protein FNV43_RR18743 [Rhamnella rubrinervis]|uniref:Protein MIZU-KUSSEI 1 n=1 Tax=Rhamnella rubrinervis TaxID=2594499 RepID=A0A8K0E6H1_9ROSA|nr:hypothetical protein FNV43_RR18743 [Rhamnella rubrinervis]